MFDERVTNGWIEAPSKDPDWVPLEKFLPLALCGPFMFMHSVVLEDGSILRAYKHADTRRYLLIDVNGDPYESLDRGRYRRMRHSDAIEQVFSVWWLLEHATDQERETVRVALREASDGGDGDAAAGAHILPASPACALRWLP